ncbi:major facilitator superfamily MFS_1 [Halalkaliarchaeum desulfuricum]|uniref:Major facilitator superfamily MFS_1 n=1 Tax=Halalkaliarchaeum desulfuricum TaxID=2055893 RepID=A0A343TM30_9EURY|nr:MFS transporter [Halalkaliarchaeum desulfuricum]AUX10152.1 major facilitator superfamily MFS_1 [Halalkaliarchaeum desulfuricum]
MVDSDTVSETSDGVPWTSPRLQTILASSLIGVMGVSLLSPVLPALRTTFMITDAQVGLIITIYTLPGIFLTPFVGLVADRLGRRRTLIPLLFLFGIAGAAIAGATTFRQVLGLRFLQGIGASALIPLAVTLIGDYYSGNRQQTIIGLNSSVIGTGAGLFPLIGGVLAAIRWNVPFLFFAVGILVGLVAVFVLEEPSFARPKDFRTYIENTREILLMPAAFGIYLADIAVFFLFYGGVLTAIPLLLTDEYGVVEPYLGLILSIVSFTNAAVASQFGRVEQRFSIPLLVAFGFVLFGISFLGVGIVTSPFQVALLLVVFGAGFGLVMPALNAAVVTLTTAQTRASMAGVQTSMLRIGQTVGPVAFTVLAGTMFVTPVVGYRVILPAFGALSIVGGIVGWVVVLYRRSGLPRGFGRDN